jgi:hypothetical protein
VRVRIAGPVVIGLLAALVLTSCGDGDDENALSEAELIRRGNEICSAHAKNIEDAARSRFGTSRNVPGERETVDFAENVVAPELDRMADELEDLNAPEEEEGDFRSYVSQVRSDVDNEVKQNPVDLTSELRSSDPLAESNEKAEDVGLHECHRVSERVKNAMLARAPR